MHVLHSAGLGLVTLLTLAGQTHAEEGERVFRQRCASCHSLEAGVNRSGPTLHGVMGRVAGSLEGARYSAAMRNSDLVWSAEQLDAFLAAPRSTIPGTSMTFALRDPVARGQVVAYLTARTAEARSSSQMTKED